MDLPLEPFRRVSFDLPSGRFAGIAAGPPTAPVDLIFLHANGLNARAYRALLAPLTGQYHVMALDMRGHGLTEAPVKLRGHASWKRFADDIVDLIVRGLEHQVVLAGHSMGGTAALLAYQRRPDLVRGLCMIDPVILEPGTYAASALPFANTFTRLRLPIARAAAKRRNRFESREDAFALLKGRGFYATWSDEALRDFLEDGLMDADDGNGLELACHPRWEAANFAAQGHDPWAALRIVPAPVTILRAEKGSTTPLASAKRIEAMRKDFRVVTVDGSSHALPFERGDRVRAAIETALVRAGPMQVNLDRL
jgi:pimeloyl-ACP methyl ester carboxylesterase